MDPERGKTVTADLEARFDRHNVVYKTVDETAIEAAIFIPKPLTSSSSEATSAPVLVHFHGGCLITGAVPEPFFLADWVRDLAYTTNAIFVSAGYRLAPETPAVGILDDVADFWAWLYDDEGLAAAVRALFPHVRAAPDLDRVAAVGESAGGYLALQSALHLHPTATATTNSPRRLRAVIAQYPSLFTDLAAFDARPAQRDPALEALVAEWAAAARASGRARVSAPWPGDAEAMLAALAEGLVRELLLGPDPAGRLTLRHALDRAGDPPPPVWIVQGDADDLVPRPATDELVERLRAARPAAEVKYTVMPGGGHGFDALSTLEDDWVREGVAFIKRHWLE
ncbi:hypothetical protein VTH06DRAFT_100 [Thermothelomyces fergusii]